MAILTPRWKRLRQRLPNIATSLAKRIRRSFERNHISIEDIHAPFTEIQGIVVAIARARTRRRARLPDGARMRSERRPARGVGEISRSNTRARNGAHRGLHRD